MDVLNQVDTRSLVEQLEGAMLTDSTIEKPDCPLTHRFSTGVCIREIVMPRGSLIVGHEHTTAHFNIISKGSCILIDLDTQERKKLVAPITFESKSGIRKVLYIVEDTTWSTVHVTEETDIGVLESTLVKQSEPHKLLSKNNKLIGG